MLQQSELQNLLKLEQALYKKLGRRCFLFISPLTTQPEFLDFAKWLGKPLLSKYKKPEIKKLIDAYIKSLLKYQKEFPPAFVLEFEKDNLHKLTLSFLYAQNIFQQLRWHRALPELATYSLEFFIPPIEENERVGLKPDDFKLKRTMVLDLPFALLKDENGEFDLGATVKQEKNYHLIKSKLAFAAKAPTSTGHLFNRLLDYPERALFTTNHADFVESLAQDLSQVLFDIVMAFSYMQLQTGTPVKEVIKNSVSFLQDKIKRGQLEELLVFRTDKETPLDLYVLKELASLREAKTYLKESTLKDYYSHVFKSLEKHIMEGFVFPGGFYGIKIRESTKMEREYNASEYLISLSPVLENGKIFAEIKEHYLIRLSDDSMRALIYASTGGLEQEEYFL